MKKVGSRLRRHMAGVSEEIESHRAVSGVTEDGSSLAPSSTSSSLSDHWKCCGSDYPRCEIVFLTQVLGVYAVAIASIYNLMFNEKRSDRELWIALLSSALGYMLPGPALGPAKTSLSPIEA